MSKFSSAFRVIVVLISFRWQVCARLKRCLYLSNHRYAASQTVSQSSGGARPFSIRGCADSAAALWVVRSVEACAKGRRSV